MNGSNINTGLPGVNDSVKFLGDVDNGDCVLTATEGAQTVAAFFMGRNTTTNYTGTLYLYVPLTVKGGGFTMQSGTIYLDEGTNTPAQAGLIIQDLPSGIYGGAWSGGTIEDGTGADACNSYVLIQASTKNTTINDTGSNTTLKADMTIQGTSSYSATFALTSGMAGNLTLGGYDTITVGTYGHLNMTATNTDGSIGTTDDYGGIDGTSATSTYAVVINTNGELDRGTSSDTANEGGVRIYNAVKNNGGTVKIFPGDRLDIFGTDGSGRAYYQTGSSATTTLYLATDTSSYEFTGTLETAAYTVATQISGGNFGDIDINNGSLTIQCYTTGSGYTVPAFPAIVMGPLADISDNTTGTLNIDSGAIVIVTANGRGEYFNGADLVGSLSFSDGAIYKPDVWPESSPNACAIYVEAFNSDRYSITISSTGTVCNMQVKNGNTFSSGQSVFVLHNQSGGTNSGSFATNEDSQGENFTGSWATTDYDLTK